MAARPGVAATPQELPHLEVQAEVSGAGGQPLRRPGDPVPDWAGHVLEVDPAREIGLKCRVTGEELIAAVAAEGDGDVLPGEAREQVGRHDSGVGQRLVEEV